MKRQERIKQKLEDALNYIDNTVGVTASDKRLSRPNT